MSTSGLFGRLVRLGSGLQPYLLAFCLLDGRAGAAEPSLAIDLPPAPLRDSLLRLAATGHLQLLYDPELVRSAQAPEVSGVMTPTQALERLLARTGVGYRYTADDAIALFPKIEKLGMGAPPESGHSAAPAAATITVTAARDLSGYLVQATPTALRSDGASLTVPVTTSLIPEQLLQDAQATRLEDVMEQVSGVESVPNGQSAPGFAIRGIPTYQYYVDGVRVSPDLHHDGFRELANVERIDVVKGPASILYGRTEPGGVIDVATKQPTDEPLLCLTQQTGAFARVRTHLDMGGPLSAGAGLTYRFNAVYEDSDSFRGHMHNHRLFLAPVVTWKVSAAASLTAYAEVLRSEDPTDSGLPVIGSALPPVPVGHVVESGGSVRTRDLRLGLRGRVALGANWRLQYHLDSRRLRTPQRPQLALADDGIDPGSCTRTSCPIDRTLVAIPRSRGRTLFTSAELHRRADLWGVQHALVVGAEYFETHGHSVVLSSLNDYPTDLFTSASMPVPDIANADQRFTSTTLERWFSGYLQDHLSVGDAFHLLLGIRYDHVHEWLSTSFSSRVTGALGTPPVSTGSDELWDRALKRRAGVLWHPPGEPFSVFANYAENFGISTGLYGTGIGGSGNLVPPGSAHEWEVGVKVGLPRAVIGSMSWFDLTQQNIVLPLVSPVLDAQGFRDVTGAVRSRGLEFDVRADLSPELHLLASYAYLEGYVLSGTPLELSAQAPSTLPGYAGNRLFGVPRHGASLWLSYERMNSCGGLRAGAGLLARSWREGDNANDYQLPGFARVRMMVGYCWPIRDGRLTAQLNVDNALNARYFESIGGTQTVLPGSPRRWTAALRWEL